MNRSMRQACDGVLDKVASAKACVPGIVAVVTDPNKNLYEGVRGVRDLGTGEPLTLDPDFTRGIIPGGRTNNAYCEFS